MPTKKTVKKATKKSDTTDAAAAKAKLPVGKGPITYTTSNTFKASVSKVWDAATKREHLIKYFIDDMRGEFGKPGPVEWFWKEWGWMPIEVVKYVKNKELIIQAQEMMGGKYKTTVRYEILRKDNKTIFRVHESGYARKDLKSAFMMCEGWTEFHCYLKAHLMGVDLRKAG